MGGPTSAIIIANPVLQLVGGRSHIRSLMPPAELKQREEEGVRMRKGERASEPGRYIRWFSVH